MIVSFSLTEYEFRSGQKIVTRRRWKPGAIERFQAGTIHHAWSAIPYVKSRNPRKLAIIRATCDAYLEPLGDMTKFDLLAEGGMCATVEEFCELVNGDPDEQLAVCWFEIVEFMPGEAIGELP